MCGYGKLKIIFSIFGLLLISVICSMYILNHRAELGHSIQHHANVHALQKQTYHDRNSLGISGIANRSDDQPSTDTAAGDSIIAAEARRHSDTGDCDIRFAEQKLPVVALASPPGAGSTWVRHLLQQATGIYTGSVYHDEVLFKAGFLGEMEDPYAGKVIITKIHKPIKIWHFSSVILLIRNIYDASLSEVNRRKTGLNHTAITDLTKITKKFALTEAKHLAHVVTTWLSDFRGPILVVHYEELLNDTVGEVSRMLDFLHVSENKRRMKCLVNDIEGNFHRRAKFDRSEKYKVFSDIKGIIDIKIESISKLLAKRGDKPMATFDFPS